jgi:hypothetical protein
MGVQIRDAKVFLDHPERLKILDLPYTEREKELILNKAESYVGSMYDLPLIFSFVWEWFEGDQIFDNMLQSNRSFTCSEFIARSIRQAIGKDVIPGRNPHTIRPRDLEIFS